MLLRIFLFSFKNYKFQRFWFLKIPQIWYRVYAYKTSYITVGFKIYHPFSSSLILNSVVDFLLRIRTRNPGSRFLIRNGLVINLIRLFRASTLTDKKGRGNGKLRLPIYPVSNCPCAYMGIWVLSPFRKYAFSSFWYIIPNVFGAVNDHLSFFFALKFAALR